MSQAADAGSKPASNLVSLFFSFEGRINRARYWLGAVILLAVTLALVFAIILLAPALWFAMIPIGLVALVIAVALAVKRLHDRNKSGWWSVPFIVLPGILDRLSNRVVEDGPMFWVLALIAFVLSIWGLIEMGFRKGTVGDNQYGPDPLGPKA